MDRGRSYPAKGDFELAEPGNASDSTTYYTPGTHSGFESSADLTQAREADDLDFDIVALLADGSARTVEEFAISGLGGVGVRVSGVRDRLQELEALGAVLRSPYGEGRSRRRPYRLVAPDGSGRASRTIQALEVARRISPQGLRPLERWVLAVTRANNSPLDPEQFDDAAVLLRAVTLAETGVPVIDAVEAAWAELNAVRLSQASSAHEHGETRERGWDQLGEEAS